MSNLTFRIQWGGLLAKSYRALGLVTQLSLTA